VAIGGSVGAMHALSDPLVYEISERVKRDERALRERVATRSEDAIEVPEYLVAENRIGQGRSPEDAAREAGVVGDSGMAEVWNDSTLSRDPMSALGVLMGDQIGESFGYAGLGRAEGFGGGGTIGYGGLPLAPNAVLENNFLSGNGVRARLEQLLDHGLDVDGERVRLSAFTDRHSLPYPVPTDRAVSLHAELERPRVVAGGDRVHLSVALVGRRGERPRRPHMDVRLVLDVSGSMAGEKLDQALLAARRLVARLRPRDRLGIVAYETTARVVLPPAAVGDGRHARGALRQLEAGGGTNIEAGLRLAAAEAPRRDRPGDVGLVILVSDGEATDGITSARALGAIARGLYDEHGVLTTTIGLGTSFDEETMLTIAREGSGSYHFVRDPEDIAEVLTDELDERAQAIAQALRVRVELAPGVSVLRVYGTQALGEAERAEVRATELATDARIAEELGVLEDRDEEAPGIRMHLPTFRRGDDHVILFELEVPPGEGTGQVDLARVFLDYKDLVREENAHEETRIGARRVGERRDALASMRREVRRTVLAFSAAEALSDAAHALDAGNARLARTILDERREVLVAGADLWNDDQLRRDADLLSRYENVIDGTWSRFSYQDRDTLRVAMRTYAARRMR
jgi:Ca-activated chloride channel family protein